MQEVVNTGHTLSECPGMAVHAEDVPIVSLQPVERRRRVPRSAGRPARSGRPAGASAGGRVTDGEAVASQRALRALSVCAVSLLCGASLGCSQRLLINASSDLLQHSVQVHRDEPDFELARVAGLANLKLIEALDGMEPDRRELLEYLAEGFAGAAFAFAEDRMEALRDSDPVAFADERHRARGLYERGRDYAVHALSLDHPDIEDALTRSSVALARYLAEFGPPDVPALFWLGFSELGALATSDDGPVGLRVGRARAIAARLVELDEVYAHAGALLMLGVIDASAPSRLSRTPDRGLAYFEQALQLTQRRFLPAQVELARSYAVAVDDRALFESVLTEVMDAPGDILPGERLMTTVAKRRAARLLARADRLFPEESDTER